LEIWSGTLESMGKINQKFWRGKKVLVTGHTGFKGSWLSLWLQQLGAQVTGYALEPPTEINMFELAGISKGMKSITADVRDLENLKKVFRKEQPEIVIHLAGQPIVKLSYDDPILTYTTNVMGTAHILEAAKNISSTRAMVCITSDKCYENNAWVWGYRENDKLGGSDPYASSKACAELIISAYRNSYMRFPQFNISLASTRAGNVIGGGDWARDRLVPDIMRNFINKETVLIRNPKATRPWQHVLEPLSGYLMLAESLYREGNKFAEAWNFGPNIDQSKPVSFIVDYLTKGWGEGATWKLDEGYHPHEDLLLALDSSKAKRLLKWHPKLSLKETLDWTIDWYKAYANNEDMRKKTIKQIEKYQNLK